MDWQFLFGSMGLNDKSYPPRTARLVALQRVLCGTQYEHLTYDFQTEKTEGNEYVPLNRRRPSVQSNLCRVVVDDSTALVFGDGHMPTIQADDEPTRAALAHIMKEHHFGSLMLDAAVKGSVGSVVLRMRILKFRPFFDVMTTEYLTPKRFDDNPNVLERVTEKRKAKAKELRDLGYDIDETKGDHWFQREWTVSAEIWYRPWPVSDDTPDFKPAIDEQRTVEHGLGFVPMVWVRNLPGGDALDGDCTFERAIGTVAELDYLLSQSGRGLRYSSDPTLVLKGPDATGGAKEGGAARALVVAPEGDAKLLEINGTAAKSVLDHCKELRVRAMEQMHGNQAHPDKMTAAQSGRAMELLNQNLVWLAGKLRVAYGEGALLKLLQMICRASTVVKGGLIVRDSDTDDAPEKIKLSAKGLWLKWPDWYRPTGDDRRAEMNAFAEGITAGVISRETAVQTAMELYDVQDLQSELARIKQDQTDADARLKQQAKDQAQVQVKATERLPDG